MEPWLSDYWDRIHFPREETAEDRSVLPPADFATLATLVRHHIEHIPFENIDVLRGVPIRLDLASLIQKLIVERRGGYCFEQNILLLEVLSRVGFQVVPISARVRLGRERDFTPARTHVFLRVELEEQSLLVDVGVGGLSPTSPLRLELDTPQETSHEPRRLIATGSWSKDLTLRSPDARLIHQVKLKGEWQDVCEFTLEPMAPIDREVANWFTSAHPESHFRNRLLVARATPNGRVTLLNRELTRRDDQGEATVKNLASQAEVREALRHYFGLEFPGEIRFPGFD
jgi:N-hydroxyarylamine O-acetyltransferase